MRKPLLKIILPSVLSVFLFVLAIFLFIIPHFQKNILNGKRETIQELTNSAWSILLKYQQEESAGQISAEEAKQRAIGEIKHLRYGEEGKDYFWITDMQPRMLMHPYRPGLDGADLNNFEDPHGKKLFVEFVKTVEKQEQGFVDYMWQWKDDSLHIVPKLSFVKLFKPWGWVIGTGIYIEDVNREIKALTKILLWISVGISFLIAMLLMFIVQQSIKIEQKRLAAESDLQESKEKYKTLVEATLEGLLLIMDGKINYANNVLCKMTGFEYDELIQKPLQEVFRGPDVEPAYLLPGNIIKEGSYEIRLQTKIQGTLDVLLTSSSAVFFGKRVNIVVVKDINIHKASGLTGLDFPKLLNLKGLGFFRTEMDASGKFVFASDATLRILGYDSFGELAGIRIVKLFVHSADRKELMGQLLQNGFVKNKNIRIFRKNGDTILVSLSLTVFRNEAASGLVCDGIMEEKEWLEKERNETQNLIAGLKASGFMLEQAVKQFLLPAVTIDADAPIADAIKLMHVKNCDCLLVVKNGTDTIGIVTQSDIQKRVLAFRLHVDNPVYMIMSAPVVSADETLPVARAFYLCEEKSIGHLLVYDSLRVNKAVFSVGVMLKNLKNNSLFLQSRVSNSESVHELRACYKQMQKMVEPLIQCGLPVRQITSVTSSFFDVVVCRLIEMATDEIGSPPVDFCFICLGSEGRKEESLFTDQDNAIIYENVSVEKEELTAQYFGALSYKVCNNLDFIGYSFCKGNIMAKNRQWCQPLKVWEAYFDTWLRAPEPQNLLDASIFFDLRAVYGNADFVIKLKAKIKRDLVGHSPFLYHLSKNAFATKLPHISTSLLASEKNTEAIDLKTAAGFIVLFVRIYALKNSVFCTNTLERLQTLKENHCLPEEMALELVFSYNYLMLLRLRNQAYLIENQQALSNVIGLKSLTGLEISILKKILGVFPGLQSKLSVDFRLNI